MLAEKPLVKAENLQKTVYCLIQSGLAARRRPSRGPRPSGGQADGRSSSQAARRCIAVAFGWRGSIQAGLVEVGSRRPCTRTWRKDSISPPTSTIDGVSPKAMLKPRRTTNLGRAVGWQGRPPHPHPHPHPPSPSSSSASSFTFVTTANSCRCRIRSIRAAVAGNELPRYSAVLAGAVSDSGAGGSGTSPSLNARSSVTSRPLPKKTRIRTRQRIFKIMPP